LDIRIEVEDGGITSAAEPERTLAVFVEGKDGAGEISRGNIEWTEGSGS
jgi:hypothetical protein